MKNNIGECNIYNQNGKVIRVIVTYNDGTTAYLDSGAIATNKFGIYSNSACTNEKNIDTITTGKFYVKNLLTSKKITSINIKVKAEASGYRVKIDFYKNTEENKQDLIYCSYVEEGTDTEAETNMEVEYVSSELKIQKRDHKTKVGIKDLAIKIYYSKTYDKNSEEKGWLTNGLDSEGNVKITNKMSNAKIYKTNKNGVISEENLKDGYYYIYEVKSSSQYNELSENEKLYDLEVQRTQYQDNRDTLWGFASKENGAVYLGYKHIKTSGTTYVARVDQYKSDELTIRKRDYDDSTSINGAKFKIFYKPNYGTDEERAAGAAWLGYNTSEERVTYNKTFDKATSFITGESYCGIDRIDGESLS